MDISGVTAVVTGGGSGLGAATGRALAQAGVKVALVDLDEGAMASLAGAIGGLAVGCDVTDVAGAEAAHERITASLGDRPPLGGPV